MRKYFEEIKDTRQQWKVKHKLIEVLMTGISAVISGNEYFEEIADFCKVKCEWFREKLRLALENGTASHDTYERIFGIIEPSKFERCFTNWVKSIRKKIKDEVEIIGRKSDNDVIAEYNGMRCRAIYNVFANAYFVDDVYGRIDDKK